MQSCACQRHVQGIPAKAAHANHTIDWSVCAVVLQLSCHAQDCLGLQASVNALQYDHHRCTTINAAHLNNNCACCSVLCAHPIDTVAKVVVHVDAVYDPIPDHHRIGSKHHVLCGWLLLFDCSGSSFLLLNGVLMLPLHLLLPDVNG